MRCSRCSSEETRGALSRDRVFRFVAIQVVTGRSLLSLVHLVIMISLEQTTNVEKYYTCARRQSGQKISRQDAKTQREEDTNFRRLIASSQPSCRRARS